MERDVQRRIVIGIGNPSRGDDGAGPAVVQQLRGRLAEDISLFEASGEAAVLVERLDGMSTAYLIDACVSGAAPGTIQRFDVAAAPLPQLTFSLSTHGLGLAEAVELARALGQLPPRCIVYAIEGASFQNGAGLTPAVADAVAITARQLCTEFTTHRA